MMSNVSPGLPRCPGSVTPGSILWRLPRNVQTKPRPRAVIVGHQHPRSEQRAVPTMLLLRMRPGLALDWLLVAELLTDPGLESSDAAPETLVVTRLAIAQWPVLVLVASRKSGTSSRKLWQESSCDMFCDTRVIVMMNCERECWLEKPLIEANGKSEWVILES